MSLSKVLSPSFWVDKIVTLVLQAVLTVLLRTLYVIKGEDVRVNKEVISVQPTSEKPTTQKTSRKQQKTRDISEATGDSKTVNLVTGTPSELKPEKIVNEIAVPSEPSIETMVPSEPSIETMVPSEPSIETVLKDEPIKEEIKPIAHEAKTQEKEEKHNHNLEIVCPIELRTAHEITKESDMIPIEFHWKYGGNKVFVTGDFDGWKAQKHEMHLNPDTNDFVAVVEIDRTKQHEFKFVVDGNWQCNWDFPTRYDEHGNVNNILYPNPVGPLSLESSFSPQMTATAY